MLITASSSQAYAALFVATYVPCYASWDLRVAIKILHCMSQIYKPQRHAKLPLIARSTALDITPSQHFHIYRNTFTASNVHPLSLLLELRADTVTPSLSCADQEEKCLPCAPAVRSITLSLSPNLRRNRLGGQHLNSPCINFHHMHHWISENHSPKLLISRYHSCDIVLTSIITGAQNYQTSSIR